MPLPNTKKSPRAPPSTAFDIRTNFPRMSWKFQNTIFIIDYIGPYLLGLPACVTSLCMYLDKVNIFFSIARYGINT